MFDQIASWMEIPTVRAAVIVLASVLSAHIFEIVFTRIILAITRRTKSDVDDNIALALRRPVYFTVIFLGVAWASEVLPVPPQVEAILKGVLKTLALVVWTAASIRIGTLVFHALAARGNEHSLVQPRTQPVFDIFSKLSILAAAAYCGLLIWNVNVGAWLASAGIAGLALGFAAKDTLANLFAGIFIVADSPYKVSDFIVLDDGLRGRVTAIGFRSTRMLTLDDVEITIPNGILGNSRIVNESGGPYQKARVAITVEAAYGSDIDQVREALLSCVKGAPHVAEHPKPQVRFSEFGASGLVHQLLVWIERPFYRELVVDELNRRAYKAFATEGIEIPYSKHDIYIKQIEGKLAA